MAKVKQKIKTSHKKCFHATPKFNEIIFIKITEKTKRILQATFQLLHHFSCDLLIPQDVKTFKKNVFKNLPPTIWDHDFHFTQQLLSDVFKKC